MPLPRPSHRFRTALLLVLVLAAGVRTTFILAVARHDTNSFYDAGYYELQARQLGKGHGYDDPFQFLPGHPHRSLPAADHPPLTVFTILPVIMTGDRLGLAESTTQLAVRFEMMLIGLFGIVLMAFLARRLAGETAGIVAAVIAALYPYLWVNDTLIMSETLAVAAVVGALLLTLQLREHPSWGRSVALGLVCGVAALAPRRADPARTAARHPAALVLAPARPADASHRGSRSWPSAPSWSWDRGWAST